MYHHTKRNKLAHTALLNIPPRILPPANDFIEPTFADTQLTLEGQCIKPTVAPSGTDELWYLTLC